MAKSGCPHERQDACQSEWAKMLATQATMTADISHVKDDVRSLLDLVGGNGNVGMRVELDRVMQTQGRERLWKVGISLAVIGAVVTAVFAILADKGAGP